MILERLTFQTTRHFDALIVIKLQDGSIEEYEERRCEAARIVGKQEPVDSRYFPSFNAAVAFLRRRKHENNRLKERLHRTD